jgi:GT2 family glycosyltransferase
MYGEDVEWGLRCQEAGLEVWFEPAATAVHVGRAIVDRQMNPGFAQARLVEFELSWFARRGHVQLLLARVALAIHALLRLILYAPIELRPRSSRKRLREHSALLAAALTPRGDSLSSS